MAYLEQLCKETSIRTNKASPPYSLSLRTSSEGAIFMKIIAFTLTLISPTRGEGNEEERYYQVSQDRNKRSALPKLKRSAIMTESFYPEENVAKVPEPAVRR